MSYGVLWQLGHLSEAKSRFLHEHNSEEEAIEAIGVTEHEMSILYARMVEAGVAPPGITIYEIAFPKESDPDYTRWYASLADDPESTVEVFSTDCVNVLATVQDENVAGLSTAWSEKIREIEPGYAMTVLQQLVNLARQAKTRNMTIFASHFTG